MAEQTYSIVRFYREADKPREVLVRGLTLEQAQAHCSRDDTKVEGEWFDGYEKDEQEAKR